MGRNDSIDPTEFSRILASLKRQGCSVLLVGKPGRTTSRPVCRQLLGEPTMPHRRRILVQTGPSDPNRGVAGDWPGAYTTVIKQSSTTRGIIDDRVSDDQPASVAIVDDSDLSALRREVTDTIATYVTSGLDPATLRVCLDGIDPLLTTHDRTDVVDFVEGVFERITAEAGLGHAHLNLGMEHTIVRAVRPVFDVIVEVRAGNPPEQRWHLDDADMVTAWLPVSESLGE